MSETQEGSTFKVPLTRIRSVTPHSNADRLSIVTVYGFQVIVSRDKYKVGDQVIYCPIDALLPRKVESKLFPEGSKVKLHHSRVRQIRLRGLASQGLIIDPSDVSDIVNTEYLKDEQDLKEILEITKYEPPSSNIKHGVPGTPGKGRKAQAHPDFHCYQGLSHLKWFVDKFKDGDEVIIQCKLHGTSARIGLLPYRTNTLWRKFKKWLRLTPQFEKLYGSNRVDISNAGTYKGFYGTDIYGSVFKNMDAFSKLQPNETVFGEIIGPGIQKGYEYGLKEHKFLLFDVKKLLPDGTQVWLDPDDVEEYAKDRGFEMVPILYKGPFNMVVAQQMSTGPSVFYPSEPVREGCVIKRAKGYSVEGNKEALKLINEEYLDNKSNTDNH